MNERQQVVRDVLRKTVHQQFEYGVLDCVLFAGKFVSALSGIEYVDIHYKDVTEAYKIIDRFGGIESIVTSRLGEPANIDALDDGDPVLLNLPKIGEIMGVLVSGRVLVKTQGDVLTIPLHRIKKGWHICLRQ